MVGDSELDPVRRKADFFQEGERVEVQVQYNNNPPNLFLFQERLSLSHATLLTRLRGGSQSITNTADGSQKLSPLQV